MPSNSATVRHAALDAPLLLLASGLLMVVDGPGGPADGAGHPGLAWTAGHLALLGATVLFAVLAAGLRPMVPAGARPVAGMAVAATTSGAACFLWAVIGDLSPAFADLSPAFGEVGTPPAVFTVAGPLVFSLGMLTLLGLLVAARRCPAWSPLLFGAGIATAIIDIHWLPFAALTLLAAVAPLARSEARDVPATRLGPPARHVRLH